MGNIIDFEPPAARLLALRPVAASADVAGPTPWEHYTVGDLLAYIHGPTAAFRDTAE